MTGQLIVLNNKKRMLQVLKLIASVFFIYSKSAPVDKASQVVKSLVSKAILP